MKKETQCLAYGKCDMEEYLTYNKCSKCGKTISKK